MERAAFDHWLMQYGNAWKDKDGYEFSALFSKNCKYHWTPFGDTKEGRENIKVSFENAVSTQENIKFNYEILGYDGVHGIAHWITKFRRTTSGENVTIDGILLCTFDDEHLCSEFSEWWHTTEGK